MQSLNKILIIGHLGADPELKMAGALPVVNFSVATVDSQKDSKTGQYINTTEWHKITIFGTRAEKAADILKKGDRVYIEGKLKTSKYKDKENIERLSINIIASDWLPLGKKNQDPQSNFQTTKDANSQDYESEDVPF